MKYNFILLLSLLLLLGGCASAPLKIQSTPVERVPLNLEQPAPLRITGPTWMIVTPENIDSIWQELKKNNIDLVLFAVTDNGYEQLSIGYAEIRNLINEQRIIISKYKEYYETTKPVSANTAVEPPLTFWEKIFGRREQK
jgi:hypothetical protein